MASWSDVASRLDVVREPVVSTPHGVDDLKALAAGFVQDFEAWQQFSRLVNVSWSLGRVCENSDADTG